MVLKICCQKHRTYRALRAPKKCPSCMLVYILRHQHGRAPEEFLSGLNPYAYLIDNLEEACGGLEVQEKFLKIRKTIKR